MEILSTISITFCIAAAVACGDHVAVHQAGIDAIELLDAHVSIDAVELSPFGEQFIPQRRIARIFILETWRGGDDGLDYIDRIFADAQDPPPLVYILGKPNISAARLRKLEATLPEGSFGFRNPVALGVFVNSQEGNDGVLVSQVAPDMSAALAGIVAGDLIKRMDNTNITDFDSLVEHVSQRKPGQAAVVTVVRNGEIRVLTVKLKSFPEIEARQRTKR